MLPWPNIMFHYAVALLFAVSAIHKTVAAASYFMRNQLGLESVLCGVFSLTYFNGLAGIFLNGQKVVDWLNLMDHPLRTIGDIKRKRVTVFDYLPTSVRLIMNVVMVAIFAVAASVLPFFFPRLPIFIAPTLMNAGIIADGPVAGLAWRLLLYPLELMAIAIPIILMFFYVVLS